MTQINDDDQKLPLSDLVKDSIASQSVGPQTPQLPLQGLPLRRILRNRQKRVKKTLVEFFVGPKNAAKVFPGPAANLNPVHLLSGD